MKRGKSNKNMRFDFKANDVKLEAVADILTIDKTNDNEIFTAT